MKLIRLYLCVLFASYWLTASPVMGAPILEFNQPNFTGVFGIDYPVLDFEVDIDDGDPASADYFFEWTLLTIDSSNNHRSLTSSIFDTTFQELLELPNLFFLEASDYILSLSMAIIHQVGGLPGNGPHTGDFDLGLPFLFSNTTTTMYVHLVPSAVPAPAAIWLFGIGLIGLIGFSKRRKAA